MKSGGEELSGIDGQGDYAWCCRSTWSETRRHIVEKCVVESFEDVCHIYILSMVCNDSRKEILNTLALM